MKIRTGLKIDRFGTKRYYENNELHREDGPASERSDGSKYWYLDGKRIYCETNEEFLKIVKYKWLI
jgi:hypothetical protein